MRVFGLRLVVLVLVAAAGAGARDQPQATRPDPVARILASLESFLSSSDRVGQSASPIADQLPRAQSALIDDIRMEGLDGRPRAVVRERERRPVGGGYVVLADLLVSRGLTGRLATWEIALRPR